MTPADREAYERELLASLNENIDFGPSDHRPYVLSVDLHGTYPETLITIRYHDPEQQQTRCTDADVWPWRDDPEMVGSMLHVMEDPNTRATLLVGGWEERAFFREGRSCE